MILRILLFFVALFIYPLPAAADFVQGGACTALSVGFVGNGTNTDGNNLVCVSSVWQYPLYIPQGDTTTTCSSTLAGALRQNANNVQYCDGTVWQCFYGGTGGTPNAFAFLNQTNVNPGTSYTSNAVTLSGCFASQTATCTSCTDIIQNGVDCSCTTITGTVNSGDMMQIKQTSSGSYSTATTASLTVDGVTSTNWQITTMPTLAPFSFTNQTGVAPGATITSNTVTLSGGYNLTATCNTGCTAISHNGGSFVPGPVTGVSSGDTIAIQQVASSSGNTATLVTVTVGSVTSSSWSVTTACAKIVTSSLSETNPYTGSSVSIAYSMAGGGGGGGSTGSYAGGGGGGSSAIINGGTVVDFASGGNGSGGVVTSGPASNGSTSSGSFTLASGANLTAYVGGGGGSGSQYGGGGGGAGYFGGGGADWYYFGYAGTNAGGTAGDSYAAAGSSLAGGYGGWGSNTTAGGGAGGTGGTGGAAGTYSSSPYGGGGGGYGAGGGDGNGSSAGGSNGANGSGTGGGLGASTWSTSSTLPGAAGASGGHSSGVYNGGNGGLVIMLYTPPSGGCML